MTEKASSSLFRADIIHSLISAHFSILILPLNKETLLNFVAFCYASIISLKTYLSIEFFYFFGKLTIFYYVFLQIICESTKIIMMSDYFFEKTQKIWISYCYFPQIVVLYINGYKQNRVLLLPASVWTLPARSSAQGADRSAWGGEQFAKH